MVPSFAVIHNNEILNDHLNNDIMSVGTRMTAFGPITISEKDGRITSLSFDPEAKVTDDDLDRPFGQLDEYLSGRRRDFDLDLCPEGTDFQKDVWSALLKVPYGRTVSYSELAKMSGHPNAQRAVGNAVGKNPIPIIIPCHRVIRSDGSIGGFSLGVDLKKRLLRLEGSL